MTSPQPVPAVTQAFVLGAGLGTRLKKLTETLPKPLVPVVGRPLISHAFDHLIGSGVERFIVNTHHRAEAYQSAFPTGEYQGRPIAFRHEPQLLETGGGLKNIEDLTDDAPLLVYNGDIYSTLPLAPAIGYHMASGHDVTLILRSEGAVRNVAFQPLGQYDGYSTGAVIDMRHRMERHPGNALFTGIYLISPGFFKWLAREKVSVVEPLLEMIKIDHPVGAIVIDEGQWWDLGTRGQLLSLHAHLRQRGGSPWISPEATVEAGAIISGASVIPAGVTVGRGAIIHDSLLWEGSCIEPGADLIRCIVTGNMPVSGRHRDEDL